MPEPVVPETMVCCVSARSGQGTPAMRGLDLRAAGKNVPPRREKRGVTRLPSAWAEVISAPRTLCALAMRRPRNQKKSASRATPPNPIQRPSQAFS